MKNYGIDSSSITESVADVDYSAYLTDTQGGDAE